MRSTVRTIVVLALGAAAGIGGTVSAASSSEVATHQHSLLAARSVLPAATFRIGSPPSGAFLTAGNLADAATNHVVPSPPSTTLFASQPVQGVSAVIPAGQGQWWALADNGYGTRNTSADWQLAIYRMDLGFADRSVPRVLETVLLSDPARHVPWKTVCDPTVGADLPSFTFNVLPAAVPPACGGDPAARLLTGFDFDPESVQVARDGTFWVGEEFGPFVLHADRQGRLLESPIAAPGLKSPQNPTLDVLGGERPTVAQSRGFEGMAISPDREHLYPMLEGAVGADDPADVRILQLDVRTHRFASRVRLLRLEMPGAKVDLSVLKLVGGTDAYPGATKPVGTGGQSAAELTAVNDHELLVVERDGLGDGLAAPRFKKVFLLQDRDDDRGEHLGKQLLIDLMAVPDPAQLGGDGDFFRFPFNTIEAVHVASPNTVVVANDNNYPFSNGRSRSRTSGRVDALAPDDNEFILVRLGQRLDVDRRLLAP